LRARNTLWSACGGGAAREGATGNPNPRFAPVSVAFPGGAAVAQELRLEV